MKHGTFTVAQLASLSTAHVIVKDNGNGKELFNGTGGNASLSEFSDCYIEAVSIASGKLVMWLHHDEVAKKVK